MACGGRSVEATTLNSIGFVYEALGENQKALDYFHQSLPIGCAVGDRSGEAGTLNNIDYLLALRNNLNWQSLPSDNPSVFMKPFVKTFGSSPKQPSKTTPKLLRRPIRNSRIFFGRPIAFPTPNKFWISSSSKVISKNKYICRFLNPKF